MPSTGYVVDLSENDIKFDLDIQSNNDFFDTSSCSSSEEEEIEEFCYATEYNLGGIGFDNKISVIIGQRTKVIDDFEE
eukprot:Pgem_evm1s356